MNTDNKNTEVDNMDKKLHISDVSCRSTISNRLKEIKDEINQLKETKEYDYLLKIDLLNGEYTKLYGKLLSE
jgi:CRISPR/Cas system type I-B associated protein Csh2 (Cas7 group RAMP superfamily)